MKTPKASLLHDHVLHGVLVAPMELYPMLVLEKILILPLEVVDNTDLKL